MPADHRPPDIRAGMALNRALIIFAVTLAPVTAGGAVIGELASHHVLGYWWLAVPLGCAAVPLAVLVAGLAIARRLARTPRPGRAWETAGPALPRTLAEVPREGRRAPRGPVLPRVPAAAAGRGPGGPRAKARSCRGGP